MGLGVLKMGWLHGFVSIAFCGLKALLPLLMLMLLLLLLQADLLPAAVVVYHRDIIIHFCKGFLNLA